MNRFDAYEIRPVVVMTGPNGTDWTLYGLMEDGSVEAIADRTSESEALQLLFKITGIVTAPVAGQQIIRPSAKPAVKASVDSVADAGTTIDITPVGCKTPEGAARVANAIKEFEDSSVSLANASIEFFDTHENDILHCMTMYEGVAEDVHQIRALIGARHRKQDAFLRAVAGS